MLKRLTKAGIEWHLTLPLKLFNPRFTRPDLRNHRKIVVIDNAVGFVGSQNLIDRTYHKKKNLRKGLYYTELVARVAGPVVREFNALFMTDWYTETDDILVDDLPVETRGRVYRSPVTCSARRCPVVLATPMTTTSSSIPS